MGRKLVAVVATLTLVFGCARQPKKPPQTQLEVREFQTRSFQTHDTKMVMKALLNVLQDDGYVVKHANVELGLINASKETDLAPDQDGTVESPSSGQWIVGALALAALIGLAVVSSGGGGSRYGYDDDGYSGSSSSRRVRKTEVVDCTGNVSEFGEQTRVRVSFQRKILGLDGNTLEVEQIDDAKFYQDFFAKVDKGLFLQEEQL